MTKDLRKAVEADEGTSQLLHSLRNLIQNARQRALRAVDAVQVQTLGLIARLRVREGVRCLQSEAYAGVLSIFPNSRRIAS